MLRDEYLRRLVDEAHLDIYLSATDGARIYWPWRMQPVHEADNRHRDACENYIVDSSFKDESITNKDVLDTAATLDAEVAVLADVYQDKEATVDAILDGVEVADDHRFDGEIMVPLQAPHVECWQDLEGQADMFAIGGMKDKPDDAKLNAAKAVRDAAGPSLHLHGLGFGITDRVADTIRTRPKLLDSIDYSTPIQNAMNQPVASGKERMSVVASRAATKLIEDLRRVSPYPEHDTEQQTLFAATDRNNSEAYAGGTQ